MTKLDWDRVRRETLAQRHGTESIGDVGTRSVATGSTSTARKKRTLNKQHRRPRRIVQAKQRCPYCGKMKVGIQEHIRDKHPGITAQKTAPKAASDIIRPPIPEHTTTDSDVLKQIGVTLLRLQDVEYYIAQLLKHCFPAQDGVSIELLLSEDRHTVDHFVTALRQHAAVEDQFEMHLRRLLTSRNILVHRLRHEKWFTLRTDRGIMDAWRFLAALVEDIEPVVSVFHSHIVKHGPIRDFATEAELFQMLRNNSSDTHGAQKALANRIIQRSSAQPSGSGYGSPGAGSPSPDR